MNNSFPICPKCARPSAGGICNWCRDEERQVARNIEATLSIQEQMLQEQRQMAEDQRLFNQKMLEQAISKEEAFENGSNYEFKDGDIQFSEDGFEFNVNNPYITNKLVNSFYEGLNHNFNNHFPNIDWSDISNQVAEAAIDFRVYLGEKINQINENPPGYASLTMPHMGINPATGKVWTVDEVKAYADNAPGPGGSMSINEQKRMFALNTSIDSPEYERRFYKIIKESNIDGKKYCLHLLCVKFKVGYDGPGKVFVEGIESAYMKNSSLWKAFNDLVDLINLLAKANQHEKIIQSNENLLVENNHVKKSNFKIYIIILMALAVSYLLYLGSDTGEIVKKPVSEAPPSKDTPVKTDAVLSTGLPKDIKDFIEKKESCDYFMGEEPYDAERGKFLKENLEKFCPGTDAQLDSLKIKYKENAIVIDKLSTYSPIGISENSLPGGNR